MTPLRQVLPLLAFLLALGAAEAQNIPGLSAYYSFEGSLEDASGTTANAGMAGGTPAYACGFLTGRGPGESLVAGPALGGVAVVGPVTEEFNREDLTISFYLKPEGTDGVQNLLSKQAADCSTDSALIVQYLPADRTLRARFTENANKRIELDTELPEDRCWHHVVLRRRDTEIELFLNGELVDRDATAGRIDLSNEGPLLIAGDDCNLAGETPFEGFIDELAIFSTALEDELLGELFFFPDRILNPGNQIFLGQSVTAALGPTCGAAFQWSPAGGVAQAADIALPDDAEPVITPTQAGLAVYALEIIDGLSACVARDTLQIQVIDPADLDCNRIFLPTAFTPNGDGNNDGFGISNPFAVQDMRSLEIFDRWGSRVYTSSDPFERWDGTHNGEALNPGVLLYRLQTVCDGEERLQTGTVTLIR